jgi:Uma2 family endonuclease
MIRKLARNSRNGRRGATAQRRSRPPAAPALPATMKILDADFCQQLIKDRQAKGIDRYDEVWEGVYVMPPMASNWHQDLVGLLTAIFRSVLPSEVRVQPGANVSDRREGWEKNYRCPDVVVVLPGSRAVDCGTHWFGGPDFLVEVRSPGDDSEAKLPFYAAVGVRELLIMQRDERTLRLFRHDGSALQPVGISEAKGKDWLPSTVIPFRFHYKSTKEGARTELERTDGVSQHWVV